MTLENCLTLSIKVKIPLSYDPEILPLGICSKGLRPYIRCETCTRMFIVTLFQVTLQNESCLQMVGVAHYTNTSKA